MKVKSERPRMRRQSQSEFNGLTREQIEKIHRPRGKTEVLPMDKQPAKSSRKTAKSIFLPKTEKRLPKR